MGGVAARRLRQEPFTYAGTPEAGNIPAFHLVAEAGMAVSAVTAGTALRRGWPQRRGWALTA